VPYPGYTTEEIARRGQELYEQNIRRRVEPEQIGRFLVVDVESGDYEVAEDDLSASDRMLARRPDAMLYGLRVGHDYAYRLGGRSGQGPRPGSSPGEAGGAS
jgi:hypothetical protein